MRLGDGWSLILLLIELQVQPEHSWTDPPLLLKLLLSVLIWLVVWHWREFVDEDPQK